MKNVISFTEFLNESSVCTIDEFVVSTPQKQAYDKCYTEDKPVHVNLHEPTVIDGKEFPAGEYLMTSTDRDCTLLIDKEGKVMTVKTPAYDEWYQSHTNEMKHLKKFSKFREV